MPSPEALSVCGCIRGSEDELSRLGYAGRTVLSVDGQESIAAPPNGVAFNADNTQLLIFPSAAAWSAGTHKVAFKYHRNYGDETMDIDHRYDRPNEFQHCRNTGRNKISRRERHLQKSS
jgi:hypothetical protein